MNLIAKLTSMKAYRIRKGDTVCYVGPSTIIKPTEVFVVDGDPFEREGEMLVYCAGPRDRGTLPVKDLRKI